MKIDIGSILPKTEYKVVLEASRILDKLGIKGYLVGGIVRDMILGRSNVDVDIVVDKDGLLFARSLSEFLCGEITFYENFLTATIRYDNRIIDIASMRSETYVKSGALPIVATAQINEDSKRRDFSINSLYLIINTDSFGEVIDLSGGIKDIKQGILRILHEGSFCDDPTRILRGIKFNARFGYKFDNKTSKTLKQAILNSVFSEISKERICAEMQLILGEIKVAEVFAGLKSYGVLKLLMPEIKFDSKTQNTVSVVAKRLCEEEEFALKLNRPLCIVSALLVNTKILDVDKICQVFGIQNKWAQKILEISKCKVQIKKIINLKVGENSLTNYKIYKLFCDIPDEILIVLECYFGDCRAKELFDKYFEIRKSASIDIDGEDLRVKNIKPGPFYKKIFEYVLEQKINGLAPTRQDQIKAIDEFLCENRE